MALAYWVPGLLFTLMIYNHYDPAAFNNIQLKFSQISIVF